MVEFMIASFFLHRVFLQSSFFLWSQAGQVVGVAVGIVEELATRGSLVAAGWTIRNDSRRSRPSRNLRNLMAICLFLSGGRSAIPLSSGPEEDEDPVDCHFNSMSFLQQLSDLAIRNGRALSPQLNNLLLEGSQLGSKRQATHSKFLSLQLHHCNSAFSWNW
jgi:hypothetical protein